MKKIYNLFVFAAFAVAAACSDEGEKTGVTDPAAGNLQFVTRTPQAASGRGPVYDTAAFWRSETPARTMSTCRTSRSAR